MYLFILVVSLTVWGMKFQWFMQCKFWTPTRGSPSRLWYIEGIIYLIMHLYGVNKTLRWPYSTSACKFWSLKMTSNNFTSAYIQLSTVWFTDARAHFPWIARTKFMSMYAWVYSTKCAPQIMKIVGIYIPIGVICWLCLIDRMD